MAAFDKVKSGIPQMDEILDYIRMGDNVVWQVTDIDEFRFFTIPYVKQAIEDRRDRRQSVRHAAGPKDRGHRT